MAIKGASVAYAVVGGLVLFSGIKGSSLADTARAVLSGNLSVTNTEAISAPAISGAQVAASNTGASDVSSGAASANYLTIAEYLVRNGYSEAAAAGIVGCIAGESGGNPESVGSGGNGLIGWTPPKPGIVTGNPTADLQAQLPLLLQYNQIWAQYIPMLNAQTDPVAAADFYSQYFERPAVRDSDVRPSVATSVYSTLKAGGTSPVPTG